MSMSARTVLTFVAASKPSPLRYTLNKLATMSASSVNLYCLLTSTRSSRILQSLQLTCHVASLAAPAPTLSPCRCTM